MALTFPISASIGQTYQSGSSNTYEWTGTYWKIKNITTRDFVGRTEYNIFSASINSVDKSFATTGSNQFNGKQSVTGSVNFGQQTGKLAGPHSTGSTDLITLWDFHNGNPTGYNYAIGVEPNHVWFTMDVPSDGGGFKFYSQDKQLFKIGGAGTLFTSGSIIPETGEGTYTSSFSLGSPTNAWKDLYISHGSIIFVDAVTQETSSFSISNEPGLAGTVQYSAGITASYYLGDGANLTNISSNTNWNANKMYTVRETEQLTFSGDYILENCFLQILGSDADVQYSPNKYFKKEGTIFIGGNLLLKDSTIENNGKISVGGEVILIGNSQITGTGTII